MTRYGYVLSADEYRPAELVRQAQLAEQAGFDALWISDHFHLWPDEMGQSGNVWLMIGAIAKATALPITAAVTCSLMLQHPALVAQAAATCARLAKGRFALVVGTSEGLDESVVGQWWPGAEARLDMLEEAIEVTRKLFDGGPVTHTGSHYAVETARLYSVPDTPPKIYLSGFGEQTIVLAARVADGYMSLAPNADSVRLYRESGGGDRPVQGGLKVYWGDDAVQARTLVRDHVRGVRAYTSAGFDEVYIGQIGPGQDGFFDFYSADVLPRVRDAA